LRKQPKSIRKAPKLIRKQIYSINVEKITTQQNEVVQATSRGRRVCRPQRFNILILKSADCIYTFYKLYI